MLLFAFLDESGDYAFNTSASKFLVFAGVVVSDPMLFTSELNALRYDLHRKGICLDRFHACNDQQEVRNRVFDVVCGSTEFEVHSIVVRKNRVNPSLRKYGVYPVAYRTLLRYLVGGSRPVTELHLIVDTAPDKSQQTAIQASLQKTASGVLDMKGIPYTIDHHTSHAHCLLQVADYCAWAIYKKWNSSDTRSYSRIKTRVKNEFDLYGSGDRDYY